MPAEAPPATITLRKAALSSIEIAEQVEITLPTKVVFSNLADTNPSFAAHMRDCVYRQRVARLDAIYLAGLPTGSLVYGGGHFITQVGDVFLEDQFPPYVDSLVPNLSVLINAARPMERVSGEHVLIARFGVSTWGHWIGELLPKMLLIEKSLPNRFQYVLPAYAVDGLQPNCIWSSIRESIMSCGIPLNRVLALDEDTDYTFDALFAVSPIWSDYMIHPAASASLREAVRHIPANGPSKLAVVRDPQFRRSVANFDDVYRLLGKRGYFVETTGSRSFSEQIARFKAASSVFGVLGSDLTNLVFAPSGVDLIAAAPDIFGDRFFYALVLDREGQMADLRGPVCKQDVVEHKGSFVIDLLVLDKLLADRAA